MAIKPVSGFGWIETIEAISKERVKLLLNPYLASAGLKPKIAAKLLALLLSIKPVSGFGWIETIGSDHFHFMNLSIKPVSGFGWIETLIEISRVLCETVY